MTIGSSLTGAGYAAVAGVLALLCCLDASGGPREDVKEIAELINRHYFDPERAATIAEDLKRDADAGSFDRLRDRNDLIVELTERLKKLDRHFVVTLPPKAAVPATPASGPVQPSNREDWERRANYGFRRMERLPGNIAYLDLSFVANIDFDQELAPAKQAADAALGVVRGADVVILDLRNNGGGAPSMVGYLVSAFVEPKADVFNTFYSRGGTRSERPAIAYSKPMSTIPLYILTGPRTASAAESIAFTLQTSGRAITVGEPSAGAANPGALFTTPQSLAVFISTGSPRNPINGRNWEGEGVRPDVQAPTTHALIKAQTLALEKLLAGPIEAAVRTDAQWALDALRVEANPYTHKNLAGYAGSYGPIRIALTGATLALTNREGQPPQALVALQEDLFYVAGEPSRRVAFERANGTVVALEVRRPDGDVRKLRRSNDAAPAAR
jgi:hypothetical protein